MRNSLSLAVLIATLGLGLVACGGGGGGSNPPPDASVPDTGQSSDANVPDDGSTDDGGGDGSVVQGQEFHIVHASPDTGGVDVYATLPDDEPTSDSPRLVTNLEFGGVGTLPVIAAGTYRMHFLATGGTPGDDQPLSSVEVTVTDSSVTTIAVFDDGVLGATNEKPDVQVLANIGAPTSGNTAVRTVNADPVIGEVDLYSVADGANNDTLIVENLGVGDASTAQIASPAQVRIGIDVDNTNDDSYTRQYNFLIPQAGLKVFAILVRDNGTPKFLVYPEGAADVLALVTPLS